MALKVSSVNLYAVENAKAHKTFKFENVHFDSPTPIFRRGQEFMFDVNFIGRPYNEMTDKLKILFRYEDEVKKIIGARGGAWLTKHSEDAEEIMEAWSLRLVGKEGNTIKLKMRTPIICPIGCWKLSVVTSLKIGLTKYTYEHPETIYILLNPWHTDDVVYMPETHLLGEYVLNDVGKVYTGTKGRQWMFGQFEAHILPAVRKIFKDSECDVIDKSDPIALARMISRMANEMDDVGVLIGNWSGSYDSGTNPSMWTGSSPILKQYLETGKGVKFGQCWVYASVVCTICRAIGMPARVVTNISSAHDTDSTLTIDKFFSEDGDVMEETYDSVWNFHVWNDVWMARPDLPPGYGGWQAIDGTPQEESDGAYQCGPASVVAIKKGEVGFNYDMPFILAEVNADMIDWKQDEEALLGFSRIKIDTKMVGKKLLTKKPFIFDPNGDRDQDDVMHLYKDPEGSKEERLTLLRAALKCGDKACEYFEIKDALTNEEVKFTITDVETIFIGKDFILQLDIENTADSKRTVELAWTVWSIYYTGVKGHTVKKICENIEIPPKERRQYKFYVSSDDYLCKLVEFNLLKTHIIATVLETKQMWSGENDFSVTVPELNITTEGNLEVDKLGKIFCSVNNPLSKKLTDCRLAYDCPGLVKHQIMPFRDTLPEEKIKIEVSVTPTSAGKFAMVAIFYSKELHEIIGSANLQVN